MSLQEGKKEGKKEREREEMERGGPETIPLSTFSSAHRVWKCMLLLTVKRNEKKKVLEQFFTPLL